MITAKNIKKNFGNIEVLKGINLEIKENEIVSIIGKSGAGKTTLLQVLGLLDRPTNKDAFLLLDNKETNKMTEKEKAFFRNNHLGFIFQQYQLIPEFNVFENILMPVFIANKNSENFKNRALDISQKLGILNLKEKKINTLSGGEKQRVAVARALIMNPKIILADEPTGSLDSKNKDELTDILWNLRSEWGQTIVIVTHDKDLAKKSDRIIEIKDGLVYES